uniref:Uncharacterized protein n=1 Tax=Timema cristinae TaxID=61476 RepID=A0A7R9GWY1_TIMCR|nr:unnamed protein product [Timema cristinae]
MLPRDGGARCPQEGLRDVLKRGCQVGLQDVLKRGCQLVGNDVDVALEHGFGDRSTASLSVCPSVRVVSRFPRTNHAPWRTTRLFMVGAWHGSLILWGGFVFSIYTVPRLLALGCNSSISGFEKYPTHDSDRNMYVKRALVHLMVVEGYTLNGQTLLEFSHSQDMEGGGTSSELRIRVATLWVRIEFRTGLSRAYRRIQPDRNLTMWVFKVNRQLHANATLLRGKIMQTV